MMQSDTVGRTDGERPKWRQSGIKWLARLVLLCAPLGLGAKGGCEPVVVGDDCPPGFESEYCQTSELPSGPDGGGNCGGLLGAGCAEGEYCRYAPADQCGAADQMGVCVALPEACDAVYSPVCGCDDKTHGNACEAALKGVSVAREGACKPSAEPPTQGCGGLSGQACGSDEYCDYPIETRCGAADQTGTCKAIPEACDGNYDPVCGCDGKTYGNACSAAAVGVSIVSKGACESQPDPGTRACGGLLGLKCEEDEYCSYPPDAMCGRADQTGVCAWKPEACTLQYDPVCGCDGKTYGNACAAASAGISVESLGECGQTGERICGGLTGLKCEEDEYCSYPPDAMCGRADQTGVCAPKPEACTEQYEPVCGCDGKTYGNACAAASAGISVESRGECGQTGEKICGGIAGLKCEEGEYCSYPPEAMCGAADQTGVCAPIHSGACTKEYVPVCGCDDVTYGNKCMAAAAGISILREGECKSGEPKPEPKNCGGIAGLKCGESEYCNYPISTRCGSGDQFGTCAVKPDGCTADYTPVCGCDGKTYSNACVAASAGISVQASGECPKR